MDGELSHPQLRGRVEADAAIVGGGLTGLTLAALLSRTGLRVAVVEARRVASGATDACGGVVCMANGLLYAHLEKERGPAATNAYAQTQLSALRKLRELAAEGAFEWQEELLHLCAADSDAAGELEQEEAALRRAGIQTAMVSRGPFPVKAALEWRGQGWLDVGQYLRFLEAEALERRTRFFEESRVRSLDADTVYTDRGSIRAPYLIVATGYPIVNTPGWFFLRLEQRQGWRVSLQERVPWKGVYADARGAFVLHGGQMQMTGRFVGSRDNEDPQRRFRMQYASWLNGIETGWKSGADVYSADGLPFIGPYSRATPNLFVASGYGGRGILGSMTAAQAIAARVLGLPSEGYEVYSPDRRWKWGLPAEEGARYLKGAAFHASAPRCPHMGCRMVYRPQQRIWECPCHGSRFDDLGRVLSAPAVRDADARKR